MTEWLDKSDPRVQDALESFYDDYGMFLDKVLLPAHWQVCMLDGKPEVTVNADGMRALALMAPRPDAQQLTEELIEAMHKAMPPRA